MAEATVLYLLETGEPGCEVATLTVTDGETYTSRKFEKIYAATGTLNHDTNGYINITFSGSVATINAVGITDKTFTIKLFGHPKEYL